MRYHGRELRQPPGIAIVGGLLLPVAFLWFDRLGAGRAPVTRARGLEPAR